MEITVHTKHVLAVAVIAAAVFSTSLYVVSNYRVTDKGMLLHAAGNSLITVSFNSQKPAADLDQSQSPAPSSSMEVAAPARVGLSFVGDRIR